MLTNRQTGLAAAEQQSAGGDRLTSHRLQTVHCLFQTKLAVLFTELHSTGTSTPTTVLPACRAGKWVMEGLIAQSLVFFRYSSTTMPQQCSDGNGFSDTGSRDDQARVNDTKPSPTPSPAGAPTDEVEAYPTVVTAFAALGICTVFVIGILRVLARKA